MPFASSTKFSTVERLARGAPVDDRLAEAIERMSQAVVVADCARPDCPLVFVNDAFTALTGYRREEVLGRNARLLQGPRTDPDTIAAMRGALRDGRELGVEVLNYRKNGEPFWNRMFMNPIRNDEGEVAYWLGWSVDITDRKEADLATSEDLRATVEQKTLLLHEVEHRVKNNLQLISSLIQFQARRTSDPAVREALNQVLERVGAVSTVHRRLFQTEDAARFSVEPFLHDLVDDLLGRARREDLEVRFETEAVSGSAAKAAPLALLVNEILVQVLRGGFPEPGAGRLVIGLRGLEDRFRITLQAEGQASSGTLQASLGGPSSIVDIVKRQLGAEIEWVDNQSGATALITLPMERDA